MKISGFFLHTHCILELGKSFDYLIALLYLRLMCWMEDEQQEEQGINKSGCYDGVCVELEIDCLPVAALLQAPHIHEGEGGNLLFFSFCPTKY